MFSKILYEYSDTYLGVGLGSRDNRQTMKMMLKHMIDLKVDADDEDMAVDDDDEDISAQTFGHSIRIGRSRYALDQDSLANYDPTDVRRVIRYGDKWHRILSLKTTLSEPAVAPDRSEASEPV
jgi:hypothetical protein